VPLVLGNWTVDAFFFYLAIEPDGSYKVTITVDFDIAE
jgi:hypothetical protein